MIENEVLWSQKYRPHTIKDCILPAQLKTTFQDFIDQNLVPNLLLTGSCGVGKTTAAKAMLDELQADYVVFNGSLNVDKDALRHEIATYASAMSLEGTRKYIILDEADYLSAAHVQPALRNFMEEFSSNVGFILTCNYRNKIIKELHSRCSVIEFRIPKEEAAVIGSAYYQRARYILNLEKVPYDKTTVMSVVRKYFPDFRRVINELQRYAATGTIDSGILASADTSIKTLLGYLKDKNFTSARKWVAENQDIESHELFRLLYDSATEHVQPPSIPVLVLLLAKYQYQAAFAADPLINTTACLVEIMKEVRFV